MEINFLFVIVAALMPTVVGFIWYNPKVFGTAWMKVNGFTEESLKGGNMAVIMGLSLVFSLMLAFATRGWLFIRLLFILYCWMYLVLEKQDQTSRITLMLSKKIMV